MEEGLMTQLHNPSHTDPSRIGFLAGAIPAFGVVIFLPLAMPRLTGFGAALIALVVCLVIGVSVTRMIQGRIYRRQQARLVARRAQHARDTAQQIAAMKKAKGSGDRCA
jgi:uncharacterized protein HemX